MPALMGWAYLVVNPSYIHTIRVCLYNQIGCSLGSGTLGVGIVGSDSKGFLNNNDLTN